LEKIEMKKTLVAVAAMAAVTGAMADAKISGILDQAAITTSATDVDGVKTTKKSFGEDLNGFSELGVSGSEDLGNGLTATYGINLNMSIATGGNTPTIYNGTGVGLKGGFGAVTIGTSYNLNFFTNAIADASGFAGASVGQLNGSAGGLKSNILTYNAPTFVPGLSLAAEIQRGGGTTNAGNLTGYMAQYATGGLLVRYSNSTKTEAANGTTISSACDDETCSTTTDTLTQTNQMTSSKIGGTATALAARTALDKTKATAIAVTYDFGMAKVFYGTSSIKSSTTVAQIKSNTTGVSVPLGAFNVAYAVSSEKGTSDGTGLDATGAVDTDLSSGDTVSSKGSRLFVTYALSKRTTLYGMSGKASVDSIAGASSTLKTTTSSFGVKHAF
jgi:predicted porin